MIVVDTNILVYLYLPTEFTVAAEKLLQSDPHWAAPILWRSEFRNVLALYLHKRLLTFDQAFNIQSKAEALMSGNEFQPVSHEVLLLADQSGSSAYDCEFVAIARQLAVPLITADKKLLQAFPSVARPLVH